MESFKISGALFTDIITNSSAVIFTEAKDKESLYEIIDEILREAGSEKTARDLFDIYVVASKVEYIDDYLGEDDLAEVVEKFFGISLKQYYNLSWSERNKLIGEANPATLEAISNMCNFADEYTGLTDSSYVVVTKEGKESKITKLVSNLFDSDGYHDG